MTSQTSKLYGEWGIRTPAPVTRPNDLANRPLQPLEYFPIIQVYYFSDNNNVINGPKWTRTIDLTLIRRAL